MLLIKAYIRAAIAHLRMCTTRPFSVRSNRLAITNRPGKGTRPKAHAMAVLRAALSISEQL